MMFIGSCFVFLVLNKAEVTRNVSVCWVIEGTRNDKEI